MTNFAAKVLKAVRKQRLIVAGDRVAAAVSGGVDSVALLLLLLELRAELGIVLSIFHVNHKLRGAESDEDERFVAELARADKLEFHARVAQVRADQAGIEAAARELRYQAFRDLARTAGIGKIATAHTLDDQAETVLLRMMRGSGLRGLSGILPRLKMEPIEVVRPLLGVRRQELEQYLRECGQSWREDSTNRNLEFLRNRVRQRLVPVLKQEFGESSIENLADLAEIARAEEEHWSHSHAELRQSGSLLPLSLLRELSLAAQRRVVRDWAKSTASVSLSFRAVERALELTNQETGAQMELPGGRHILRRTARELVLEAPGPSVPLNYEYRLPVPGSAEIRELNSRFEARLVNMSAPNKDGRNILGRLLDPARLPRELCLRNWRAGDRFWPAHSKSEKKVKELLSDLHISGQERKVWPVITAEGLGVVWVRGFPPHTSYAAGLDTREGLEIIESVVQN
jgi:tRNA(Ile)-lysidine synthase